MHPRSEDVATMGSDRRSRRALRFRLSLITVVLTVKFMVGVACYCGHYIVLVPKPPPGHEANILSFRCELFGGPA